MKITLLCFSFSFLWALPQVPLVREGDIAFSNGSDRSLEIWATDKGIIEWKDFSIEIDERVLVHQPNKSSSLLNRVIEANPSRLLGNLKADGQIILINPNGILVGANSRIDLSSFIASTLDLQNDCFLANQEFRFAQNHLGSVINKGIIRAGDGDVCLIGARVENFGEIQSQNGIAALLAAEECVLRPLLGPIVKTQKWKNEDKNLFSHDFVSDLEAGFAVQKGTIFSQNSNGNGGWVAVLGDVVQIHPNSKIDVSGAGSGGLVWIGGDFKGSNPDIENASFTWVGEGAKILANAGLEGNGGKVIVWSDHATSYFGHIEAMGGAKLGNGGLVEVSGDILDFQGTANTSAPVGKTGVLYLDPLDITIANVGANSNVTLVSPFQPNGGAVCINYATTPPTAGSSVLRRATLIAALNLNNVTIDTTCNTGTCPSGACAGGCPGDILFLPNATFGPVPFLWTANTTLTLNAFNDILILCNILNPNAGNILLQANHQIRISDATLIGGSAGVSVGSAFGTTTVNAPCADLILQGGRTATNSQWSHIGFLPDTGNVMANGGININCNNLVMTSGSAVDSSTQIGHATMRVIGGPIPAINVNAPITITTAGNLSIQTTPTLNVGSTSLMNVIGHGSQDLPLASVLAGDININCGGNFSMTMGSHNSGNAIINRVGHGSTHTGFNNVCTGNINITTQGNFLMGFTVTDPRPGCLNIIGHIANTTITGDIFVSTCGNLTLAALPFAAGTGGGNLIGSSFVNTTTVSSNITAIAAGNINLDGGDATNVNASGISFNTIGQTGVSGANTTSIFIGDVRAIAGCSINMTLNTPVGIQFGFISNIGAQSLNPASISNTFVAAGMDIAITKFGGGPNNASVGITGVNDVNVIALNDILITSQQNNPLLNGFACIGPTQYNRGGATRVFAARDIICSNNGSVPNQAVIGRSHILPAAPISNSVLVRAKGNIQLASSIYSGIGTSGNILIEADSAFAAGELIAYNGADLAVIAGINVPNATATCNTVPNCPTAIPIPNCLSLNNKVCQTCSIPICCGGVCATCNNPACCPVPPCATCVNIPCCPNPSCCAAAVCQACNNPPCSVNTNIGIDSVAILSNQRGAVIINKGAAIAPVTALTLQTTTGNLSIHSATLQRDGVTVQNLNLSNAASVSNLNLVTVNGNIDVSGTICTDAFNSITITGPITTTGSICIRSVAALNVNFPITATGAGSSLSLVTTQSNINIAANISTVGGPLLISAGFPLTANCCGAPASCCCDAIHCCCTPLPCGTATANVASITQTAGAITTTDSGANIGTILLHAATDVSLTGAATSVSSQTGSIQFCAANRDLQVNRIVSSTSGDIIGTAGRDINIQNSGRMATGGTGIIDLLAGNNILVAGLATSLQSNNGFIRGIANNQIDINRIVQSAAGDITFTADNDNSGFGDLNVTANITSTAGGNICLASGPGTFGCSQNNCKSGLISGFPFGLCTVHISGGTVSSTTGSITITAAEDIIVSGAAPSISTAGPIALTAGLGDLTVTQQIISSGSSITTFAGNNTTLTQTLPNPTLISAVGEIRMITGLDLNFSKDTAVASSAGEVTIVVDNINPQITNPPVAAADSGRLFMDKRSSITSGPGQPLRIFSAYSEAFTAGPGVNFVDNEPALLNGISPFTLGYPTKIGQNTDFERWCTVFGCPNNYPSPNLGIPFTFFYKVCVQLLAQQAQIITTEFLHDLHPYNEFPGWMENYWVRYVKSTNSSSLYYLKDEPYYFRRRNLNVLLHPKSWTVWIE
ncbi:MAG: filamentous hemagglutinin N-terminal domain-containing protein [Parachlamydiales bacterium]|nr:filamentous hemagglutinin N-terminal domain-containing protein [Parachlamydiales bacterium]